jgi:hypothetical protein
VSPEECFSIIPVTRSLRIPFTEQAPSLLILGQGSLMARYHGFSSQEFLFLFVDGALEGTKGASEQ